MINQILGIQRMQMLQREGWTGAIAQQSFQSRRSRPSSILRYFYTAGKIHYDDEEQDLFSHLLAS